MVILGYERGAMLALKDITLDLGAAAQSGLLLNQVSLRWPMGHLAAIVGPSGCGKSTLLKVIAGLSEHTAGVIHWQGRDLWQEGDLIPSELGYVPQFSIAPERLTPRESVAYAFWLRVAGLSGKMRNERASLLLEQVGLGHRQDVQTRLLSGGQRRRLALALELVSDPTLLLCDEVTSGLDPKSEDEIVSLLYQLSRTEQRLVLSVTHSLRHLALYDSVTVLNQGVLCYQGASSHLLEYFGVQTPEDLFPALAEQEPAFWVERWEAHREMFVFADPSIRTGDGVEVEDRAEAMVAPVLEKKNPPPLPSLVTQWLALSCRRWVLLFRDSGQVALQVSLLFIFPGLIILFALNGLPQIKNLNLAVGANLVEQLKETLDFSAQSSRVGGLVSGLVMFQVILLTLMGSSNGAREIVADRLIFEKEKLAGLRPLSFLLSKVGYLFVHVLVQAALMTVIVKFTCQFPGPLGAQFLLLFLVNAAMTSTCLAISAWSRTSEQASLSSVYLVGFQLPLSGAVLALPAAISLVTQPLIVSYWGWSGLLQTMRETRFYDLVQSISETSIAPLPLSLFVLGIHILTGLVLAFAGCVRSRWE
jgi:ABC transport system ATP-binding/permease protein